MSVRQNFCGENGGCMKWQKVRHYGQFCSLGLTIGMKRSSQAVGEEDREREVKVRLGNRSRGHQSVMHKMEVHQTAGIETPHFGSNKKARVPRSKCTANRCDRVCQGRAMSQGRKRAWGAGIAIFAFWRLILCIPHPSQRYGGTYILACEWILPRHFSLSLSYAVDT